MRFPEEMRKGKSDQVKRGKSVPSRRTKQSPQGDRGSESSKEVTGQLPGGAGPNHTGAPNPGFEQGTRL